jgi:hypothetical protein
MHYLTRQISTRLQTGLALAVVAIAGPALLNASALNGNLSLSSNGTATVAATNNVIDFDFSGGVSMGFPPIVTSGTVDGSGDSSLFEITSASTSSFAPLSGSMVTVHDLDASQQPVGSTSGPGLPLANFITFAAESGWSISLTELFAGTEGLAGCTDPTGTQCTPANSPFDLINEGAGQVLVGFAFSGTATDGMGDISQVDGTFSTTFSDTSFQAILADLDAGDAIVSSASATIGIIPISQTPQTGVPEPGSLSMLLFGSGLLASGIVLRRYNRG